MTNHDGSKKQMKTDAAAVENISENQSVLNAGIESHPDFVYPVSLVSSTPSIRSIIRIVVIVVLVLALKDILLTMITSLTHVIFLIVLSIFFAYLLNPIVNLVQHLFDRRRRQKLPRALAIALSYLIVFAVLGVGIAYLAPRIAEQAKNLVANFPQFTTSLQGRLTELNNRLDNLRVSDNVQEQINEKITSFLSEAGTYLTTLLGAIAISVLSYAPWLVLIPILAFFMLKDVNIFRLGLLRLLPAGEWRSRTESVLLDINDTLAAYVRAQLVSCVLIGTICTVGFYILGNSYALLLGILAGIFEFVPLIGPISLAVIATLVAGFDSGAMAVATAGFLGVLRILQDYVFYPRIVREGIHLHPLAIILSVLAGEAIAGIPGVFIAIPLVALVTVLYKHFAEYNRQTGIFAAPPEPTQIAPPPESASV